MCPLVLAGLRPPDGHASLKENHRNEGSKYMIVDLSGSLEFIYSMPTVEQLLAEFGLVLISYVMFFMSTKVPRQVDVVFLALAYLILFASVATLWHTLMR